MDKEKLVDAIQRAVADYAKTLPPDSNGAQLIYAHRVGFARHALEAVIPSLIEAAAKVADKFAAQSALEADSAGEDCLYDHADACAVEASAARNVAAAIRSLIPSKEKEL